MRKIHKITNIALIFMLIGVVCQSFAYSLPSSREILRVPFDVKYGRLKTLQKIIQTVNQIDNYKIEKENIEKLATKATKYPQYTQVIIDGLTDFRHKRRLVEALAKRDPQKPNFDVTISPENLFPIKEITERLKSQQKSGQFRVESSKYEEDEIEISLFLQPNNEKIASINLYVGNNLEVEKPNPNLSPSLREVLWNERSGYFERPSGGEIERMYYNLNWWAGISNFWIEPILRGKGIADIWLNNYIKPYLLKNGFELAGPESISDFDTKAPRSCL